MTAARAETPLSIQFRQVEDSEQQTEGLAFFLWLCQWRQFRQKSQPKAAPNDRQRFHKETQAGVSFDIGVEPVPEAIQHFFSSFA